MLTSSPSGAAHRAASSTPTLDAVKTRERNRRSRTVTNRSETERTGSSDAKRPGRAAGSIPGSSTGRTLVRATSSGQFSFASRLFP